MNSPLPSDSSPSGDHPLLQDLLNERVVTTLAAFSVDVGEHMEEGELIQTIFRWISQVMQAPLAGIYLYDKEQANLITAAISDTLYARIGERESASEGLLGEVIRTGKMVVVPDYQRSPYRYTDWPLRAVAACPMLIRDQILGVIAVGYADERQFSPDELHLLELLVLHATVVLDNQRLYKAGRQETHQIELLKRITYAASTIQKFDELLQYLVDTLNDLFHSDHCLLALWDADKHVPIPTAATQHLRTRFLNMEPIAPGAYSLAAHMIARNRPEVVPDLHVSELVNTQLLDGFEGRTLLGVPLTLGSRPVGAAYLIFNQARSFSAAELDMITQVADQISLVITQAQLAAAEERQRLLAETQLAISAQLMEVTSPQEAGLALLENIGALMAYDSGAVMVVEEGQEIGRIVASAGYTDPDQASRTPIPVKDFPLLQKLYDTVAPIYIPNLREWAGWQPSNALDTQEVHSIFFVPLQHRKDAIIGNVTLKSFRPDAFPAATRRQVQILCNQVAATLQNQLLLGQSRAQAAELTAAYAKLQHLDQVRGDFVQNASHELRTPLTFIQGYAGLLGEGMLGEINPEQMDAVQIILQRAESMNGLIQEMVEYQKADSMPVQRESINLANLIDDCVRATHLLAQAAEVTFQVVAPAHLPPLLADPRRLGQVFDNLLSNAIKFSPQGGQVTVTLAAQNGLAAIQVADHGIGIPADQLALIWDRFYRVKSSAEHVQGSGLGLAIVRQIIEAHGGRIWAESPGTGSIFHIELPLE